MRRTTTALFVYCAVCWTSPPSQSAELTGAWKIDTRDGPAPLCIFVQVGDTLNGSCSGHQAAGTVTGTVVGPAVRWRWQLVTAASNAAAAFDFVGVVGADNTMTGVAGRRETGLSLDFKAKPFVPPGAASPPAAPFIDANTAAHASGGHASVNGWRTIVTPESEGTRNPQYRWQRIPPRLQNDPHNPFLQFDPQDIEAAHAMFPYQGSRMWQWLKDQKSVHFNRQHGKSSYIRTN
jgi:hypothetical protein